ncbi:kinase-like protein [Trametes polyzona]|nr:kinase-like protein [Trametes polyzona]
MKVVHFARGMSKTSCQGTINELKVLRTLAEDDRYSPFLLQPHIAYGLWAWRSRGQYLHILTDLCTGGDLGWYSHLLSERALALVCAEVILGLDHLHGLGIVHHDIKPGNILVDARGHCVIADYGGAQFLDRNGQVSRIRNKLAVMTVPFAAPEVLSDDEVKYPTYDCAVDYWALGATLVAMTLGEHYLPGTADIDELRHGQTNIQEALERYGASESFRQCVMALMDECPTTRVRYPGVKKLPFLRRVDWEAVRDLRCAPLDYVKEVPALAHGFTMPSEQRHGMREPPVDLLHRLRQEHLSLQLDDSYDVPAQKAALERSLV